MNREVHYARSGEVHIAYQVIGRGSVDLVLVPGWVSNIEAFWELPQMAAFLNRLATFSRLILFDKRGTGLSDRITETPTLEERMDDVRAVMDAVNSRKAALLGYSEGGTMIALFAATYPERTHSIIMIGSFARRIWSEDFPEGEYRKVYESFIESIIHGWGGPIGIEKRVPSMMGDTQFRNWWARFLRMSASPSAAVAITRMNGLVDVRSVLPSIKVPALILHAEGDMTIPLAHGTYLAGHIPNARLVVLPTNDHLPWFSLPDRVIEEIQEFITGVKPEIDVERALYTLMFTDIVGSTEMLARLGDHAWNELLQKHYRTVREALHQHRGRELSVSGDGFFIAFDGPAMAIRCALAIRGVNRQMGIDLRIGIHIGECQISRGEVSGIAVHTAARISDCAQANEILVSRTVTDLVAGSGITFEDYGSYALKGVPGTWSLFIVTNAI